MKHFERSLGVGALAVLAFAAAGCGSKPETAPTATVEGAQSQDAAGTDQYVPTDDGPSAGAITAIDAARGNGGLLPPDDPGPSAYDLARARVDRGERSAGASGGATAGAGNPDDAVESVEPQAGEVVPAPPPTSDPPPRP